MTTSRVTSSALPFVVSLADRAAVMENSLRLANRHTGETLRLRRMRDRDGQVVLSIEGSLPPGSEGPPPHIHWQQHERGTVTSGTLGARLGGRSLELRAGETGEFPAGIVHAWWNAGVDRLEFGGQVRPAGDLDRFLQAMFAVVNASPAGRPSIFHSVHVLWRHRKTQGLANPPRIVQAIVFPLVVGLGRILGKYRGSNWPGAPDSCPGAPSCD